MSRPSIGSTPLCAAFVALVTLGLASSCSSNAKHPTPGERVELEVLFTGDAMAELHPCGCNAAPKGGLALRSAAIAAERTKGPRLLLDAGDALAESGRPEGSVVAKAELVMAAMGAMGYDAMAVGERDLVLGVEGLKHRAREAKVRLLAANLVDGQGLPVFEPHAILQIGQVPVGVFALVAGEGYAAHGMRVTSAAAASKTAVEALERAGARLVIALLHMSYSDSLETLSGLTGIDYAIQSHDSRPEVTQRVGDTMLVSGGDRARWLGMAHFELGGAGPLFDQGRSALAAKELTELSRPGSSMDPRGPGVEARKKRLRAEMDEKPAIGSRTVLTRSISLAVGGEVDEEMAKRIAAAGL